VVVEWIILVRALGLMLRLMIAGLKQLRLNWSLLDMLPMTDSLLVKIELLLALEVQYYGINSISLHMLNSE
jgi:hypothetical protein